MLPPVRTPFGSPPAAAPTAVPPLVTVVVVVGADPGAGVVAGGRVVVVVDVSWPCRYLPSSVPPQPGETSVKAAARAVAGITIRSANRRPPNRSVRKRRSLSIGWSAFPPG